ncbi:methyltransferase type 11 [Bacillus wiedmannii]|uniref:Methyltransferase type 11 n=1 Tax=Bacillus wiedmannii TaxID=1890302 RepID=A0A2B5I7D5_9BACI|nr:methyltransferase type 11 [Bacillus wiedmannii]PGC15508.1 methyltransferase type 11 [Bacillus wiedmannii]PGC51804.1 methyltransferase type 11 [Bacillus wiedmannii]PGD39342.1 methyltransferase type 11 [Bacillus wiedmannii]PHE73841.1 methyltransferase type 11 [Bacillus wiedmannii]
MNKCLLFIVRFNSLFVLLTCVIVFLTFVVDRIKLDAFPYCGMYSVM